MAIQAHFPKLSDHEMVPCFNCGGDIYQPPIIESGFAQGRGKYRAHCSKCDMHTWYDVRVVDAAIGRLFGEAA